MAKLMKIIAAASVLLTVCFSALKIITGAGIFLTLAITFGTIAYHFCMRLLVGLLYNATMKNRANYNRRWFRVGEREMKLYKAIKVKKWKGKMPTYDSDVFDVSLHGWDEIAQATCQSELVHETIAVLSFLPMAASVWFGDLHIFVITSLLAAAFDLMFVIMQRYNRARILKIVKKK